VNLILILAKNGYPPVPKDEVLKRSLSRVRGCVFLVSIKYINYFGVVYTYRPKVQKRCKLSIRDLGNSNKK